MFFQPAVTGSESSYCTFFLAYWTWNFATESWRTVTLASNTWIFKDRSFYGLRKIFFITYGFATSYILLASCILHPMFFSLFKQVIAWDGSFWAAYSNWFPTSEPKVSATKWRAFCALQSSRNWKRWFMMVDDLLIYLCSNGYLYIYICIYVSFFGC